ncbi:MAG: hypothetical protein KDA44_13675 [Planctomycetales bacterium]|nr:hypothetical protein [Planctomycetales bacterium]
MSHEPFNSRCQRRLRDVIAQGVIVAGFVLGAVWILDLSIDFEGADRWLIFVIVPLSTVAGLILTAIIAGTIYFDSDEPNEVARTDDNAVQGAQSRQQAND